MVLTVIIFSSIMIAYKHQCTIISEMTLMLSLHGSNGNQVIKIFSSLMIAYNKH